MGAWGVGVFSDDLACEVRDAYRNLVADGCSARRAKEAILGYWGPFLDDFDSGPVIWLSLAVTQWKLGRLDEGTRDQALAMIESGKAARLWADEKRWLKKRESVLRQVQVQLLSAQPLPRMLRKRFKNTCEWERGEMICYRTRSGQFVVFRVIGSYTDRGGTSPVVELLDRVFETLPSAGDLNSIPIRSGRFADGFEPGLCSTVTQLFIGRLSSRELPQHRVNRLGTISEPTQQVGGFLGATWKTLDSQLADTFAIE